jgi:hypothetical protein
MLPEEIGGWFASGSLYLSPLRTYAGTFPLTVNEVMQKSPPLLTPLP